MRIGSIRWASQSRWALSVMSMYSHADRAAVGRAELLDQVAERAVGLRRGSCRCRPCGRGRRAVRLNSRQLEQRVARAVVAERVEVGDEVAQLAVGVDQVEDADRGVAGQLVPRRHVGASAPTRPGCSHPGSASRAASRSRPSPCPRRTRTRRSRPARSRRSTGGPAGIARRGGRCIPRWRGSRSQTVPSKSAPMRHAATTVPSGGAPHLIIGRRRCIFVSFGRAGRSSLRVRARTNADS